MRRRRKREGGPPSPCNFTISWSLANLRHGPLMMEIRELRARAEESLGERFDIREFHRQVLESGSLPLALLEE